MAVVAIDGLTASGKTTISRRLALRLGYGLVSSGLAYRVVGWLVIQRAIDVESCSELINLIDLVSIRLGSDGDVFVDSTPVDRETLSTAAVSEAASRLSTHFEVRKRITEIIRATALGQSVVVEGRDIGTVVFPNALIKFFLEVDPEVRLKRRASQAILPVDLKRELKERDNRDQTRSIAPTIPAKDAVVINNSGDSPDSIVEEMIKMIGARL